MIDSLNWLDDKADSMQQLLVELCNINSGTFNLSGLENVKRCLVNAYSTLDGELEIHRSPSFEQVDSQGNLFYQELGDSIRISKRPELKRQVFLCIHMDTVYSVDHPFQVCTDAKEGRINGPGVADAKGGLVVMLYALRCLEQSPFAKEIGWEVLINPDEEIGSPGTTRLFQQRAPHFDFGLLFEPAYPNGTLVGQRKGSGNFSFIVRGKSAHAGREFHKGKNAIVAASVLIQELSQLNGQVDGVTLNVGRVEGGGALNMVPELSIVRLNVRVEDEKQIQWVEQSLITILEKMNGLDPEITFQQHGYFSSPPKILDAKTESLQKAIEDCGSDLDIPIDWVKTGGASDGNKLFAAGLPNIDTFGVVGGNIHSSDEYMEINSLVPRAKLTALVLMKYAANEFQI